MTTLLPAKFDLLVELLGGGQVVSVHFDGRHPDVECPAWLWEIPSVRIDLGYQTPTPIHNLTIHELNGITGVFSFNREPHRVELPWSAVFAIGPYTWIGEVPAEARAAYRASVPPPPTPASKTPTLAGFRKRRKTKLTLIQGGRSANRSVDPVDPPDRPGPRAA